MEQNYCGRTLRLGGGGGAHISHLHSPGLLTRRGYPSWPGYIRRMSSKKPSNLAPLLVKCRRTLRRYRNSPTYIGEPAAASAEGFFKFSPLPLHGIYMNWYSPDAWRIGHSSTKAGQHTVNVNHSLYKSVAVVDSGVPLHA